MAIFRIGLLVDDDREEDQEEEVREVTSNCENGEAVHNVR